MQIESQWVEAVAAAPDPAACPRTRQGSSWLLKFSEAPLLLGFPSSPALWIFTWLKPFSPLAATTFKEGCLFGHGTAGAGDAELCGTDHSAEVSSMLQWLMASSSAEWYLVVSAPKTQTRLERCDVQPLVASPPT